MRPRWSLAFIILAIGALTILALLYVGRGDAISEPNLIAALKRLIGLYVPLLALVISFLFARKAKPAEEVPSRAHNIAAVLIVTFWCVMPGLLFATTRTIESATKMLEVLQPWGDTVVMTVLGYYFARE